MFRQESDFIPGRATDKAFVPPGAIGLFEYRERRVFVRVPRAVCFLFRVFDKSKLGHQCWHWQSALGLVNLCAQLGVLRAVEVSAAHGATRASLVEKLDARIEALGY